jgi:L-ribulose-5-phosphate 4-epimerase
MQPATTSAEALTLETCTQEMIRIAHRAAAMGLQSGVGGNISMRWGASYLVKASGSSLYGMSGKDILTVDAAGNVLHGSGVPTKEIKFHLGIYRERADIGAVVHYHAPFATAFAIKGIAIPALTFHSQRSFLKMPVIPPLPDGSKELAYAVVSAVRDRDVRLILLAAHGLVAIGKTLLDAQCLAELAEETAKTALAARLLELP